MKSIFYSFVLSIVLTGCIITQYSGLHDIINKNLNTYQNEKSLEFNNVAAILKEYSNLVNSKKYSSLKELKTETNKFIEKIKIDKISENYPVKASDKEVYVSAIFLKDVLTYLEQKDIREKEFQNYINQSLKFYIVEIMNYEEIYK